MSCSIKNQRERLIGEWEPKSAEEAEELELEREKAEIEEIGALSVELSKENCERTEKIRAKFEDLGAGLKRLKRRKRPEECSWCKALVIIPLIISLSAMVLIGVLVMKEVAFANTPLGLATITILALAALSGLYSSVYILRQ
jgi:VIT1/CCC1 family predicted Fe2+/Mn2+ transporter